jgi:ParB/RepB/Spo0J family partition protein
VSLPIKDIFADEDFNSRGKIIPLDVVDLAKDIERVGLIQPVVVMKCSKEDFEKSGCKWKLLAGFRRRYAHIVLKREIIPAIIHDYLCDADATVFNLSENLNRADLTILQEARAIRRLSTYAYNEDQVALKVGKSRGWVQVRFMLLQLPEDVQNEVEAGFINQTQIRELYTIYRSAGTEEVYKAVKILKDNRLLGRKSTIVDPKKTNRQSKRVRTRAEIIVMQEHMCDSVGVGLHTRVPAWILGEISTDELYDSIAKYAIKEGKVYIKPA